MTFIIVRRRIIELRRSKHEYEIAYGKFKELQERCRAALCIWKDKEVEMKAADEIQLKKVFDVLEIVGVMLAAKAVNETLKGLDQPTGTPFSQVSVSQGISSATKCFYDFAIPREPPNWMIQTLNLCVSLTPNVFSAPRKIVWPWHSTN